MSVDAWMVTESLAKECLDVQAFGDGEAAVGVRVGHGVPPGNLFRDCMEESSSPKVRESPDFMKSAILNQSQHPYSTLQSSIKIYRDILQSHDESSG